MYFIVLTAILIQYLLIRSFEYSLDALQPDSLLRSCILHQSCQSGLVRKLSINYKEDYNVSLFHAVCTVTVMIFCSRYDASLVYWPFAQLYHKAFRYLCMVNVIFQQGKGEQKHLTKKIIKFPNQSTLLTLFTLPA